MTEAAYHRCYGLQLSSEIPLPELEALDGPVDVDVHIRLGRLDGPPPEAILLPHDMWLLGDRCGFAIEEVGRYEIRHGREIVVDAVDGADPRSIRLFLLGTSLGALMTQRDHLVLHGNAVRIGDACAVVLGHSGAGKSTLAAEFARRGLDVFSDDVVPVDAAGLALPGSPRIKLWADALSGLGVPTDGLQRVHRSHDKFQVPITRNPLRPLPLRWVYVLERSNQSTLDVEAAHGAACFSLLFEHTYRNEFVHGPDAVRRHLDQVARVLRTARVSRVDRPAATMTPTATADAILADIARDLPHPGPGPSTDKESVPA